MAQSRRKQSAHQSPVCKKAAMERNGGGREKKGREKSEGRRKRKKKENMREKETERGKG